MSVALANALDAFKKRAEDAYNVYKGIKRLAEREPTAPRAVIIKDTLRDCSKACHRVGKEGALKFKETSPEVRAHLSHIARAVPPSLKLLTHGWACSLLALLPCCFLFVCLFACLSRSDDGDRDTVYCSTAAAGRAQLG